jgi:predicted metalloprotease with PDZ domain
MFSAVIAVTFLLSNLNTANITYSLPFPLSVSSRLLMPVTAVGLYEPIPFGRYVGHWRATDEAGGEVPVTVNDPGDVSLAPGTVAVSWAVDVESGFLRFPSSLAATHVTPRHVLVSGYSVFPELITTDPRYARTGYAWTRGPQSFFELVDSPVMFGREVQEFAVSAAGSGSMPAQSLFVWTGAGATADDVALAREAQSLAMEAVWSLGMPMEHIILASNYTVLVELFPVNSGVLTGWALEHGAGFQAMASAGMATNGTSLQGLSYHFTHHMGHSLLIPRQLFVAASLAPAAQLAGRKTGFIFFGEGFQQYLAFVALARTKRFPVETVLAQLAERFAVPYMNSAPDGPAPALFDLSLEQYADQTSWFYLFSAGALLAMKLDENMCATGDGASAPARCLAEAMVSGLEWQRKFPLGVADGEVGAVLEDVLGVTSAKQEFQRHVFLSGNRLNVTEILAAAGIEILSPTSFKVLPLDRLPERARGFRKSVFWEV